jgi:hypothetical protein
MTAEDLLPFLRPFRPFCLVTVDGERYDVRERWAFMLSRTSVVVGFPAVGTDGIYDRAATLVLSSVALIAPLEG